MLLLIMGQGQRIGMMMMRRRRRRRRRQSLLRCRGCGSVVQRSRAAATRGRGYSRSCVMMGLGLCLLPRGGRVQSGRRSAELGSRAGDGGATRVRVVGVDHVLELEGGRGLGLQGGLSGGCGSNGSQVTWFRVGILFGGQVGS